MQRPPTSPKQPADDDDANSTEVITYNTPHTRATQLANSNVRYYVSANSNVAET